jgi:hypothetical protein
VATRRARGRERQWALRVNSGRAARHTWRANLSAPAPSTVPAAAPTRRLQGIMRTQLETSVPVVFGVLCVLTEEQALQRAGLLPGMHNHGTEWAQGALQMASLRAQLLPAGAPARQWPSAGR